jgi:hypothetical protein
VGRRSALGPHIASSSVRTRASQLGSVAAAATRTLFWLRVVSEPASTNVP